MKQFRVTILVKGKRTEVILGGSNLADVLSTARKMYPKDRVLKAYPNL